MKIARLLLLQVAWVLSWGAAAAAPLDESLDETQEDAPHKLSTAHLETSPLDGDVTSVNDAPTIEREPGATLALHSGGSCIGLSGFKLGDAEAEAVENDPPALVPILRLDLSVKGGTLRVNRRAALQNAIHVVGNAGKNTGDETLAWTLPDLTDNSLVMKGAISDLSGFLPAVEYCSSPDRNVVVPDKLQVTLLDNGFCGSTPQASLSTTLEVPVTILPDVDLGELLFTQNNITLAKHSSPVHLKYTPGTSDGVDCTLELKHNDGMLLGIDYHAGILFKKTNPMSLGASRAHDEVLIPAGGLIVRFWEELNKREATRFQFARQICAVDEVCYQVESTFLDEGSSDEEILAAAKMLTIATESVTDLQVIRYPISRLWLIWNIPDTFAQDLTLSDQAQVSLQNVARRFHLQGTSSQVATQLKALKIYSLLGGIQSYNGLNIQLSLTDAGSVGLQAIISAQIDIFSASALENIKLVHPRELALDDSRETTLNTVSLWYPSTYASSTLLEWTIRSTLGSIWWDPSSVSPAVVSRQMSKHELELRGDLADLSTALSKIRVDFSNIQENNSSFMTFQADQTYDLLALALAQTSSGIHNTDLFQLRVQNRVTSPLDSCADASTVENAIRALSIDKLGVSVKREASIFVLGRFDYTVVMTSPVLISLDLVADGSTPLSPALFEVSHVSRGSESQIAFDTISMFLKTSDNSSLVASGEMSVHVTRMEKKLGIRLPVSYLQVNSNQALMIEGIDFEGYAQNLTFSVFCRKGTISFLPKQLSQSKPIDPKSALELSGYFSTLKSSLEHSHLVYSPKNGAGGYDELVFSISSVDDRAREALPIVIESSMRPPSLTLSVTSLFVLENKFVRIEGVTITHEQDEQQRLISRGISVNITTEHGLLEMATSHSDQNSQLSKDIQIRGDVDNINAALIGLRYQAPARHTTEDQILFSTCWVTESRGRISPATFTLPIKISKRPVTVKVLFSGSKIGDSSLFTTLMNTPAPLTNLSLQVSGSVQGWSHCNNTPATDIASECSATVELSLFAAHGLLTNHTERFSQESHSQDRGLTTPLVRFIGSVIQANTYLQRQFYTPDAKFHGSDQIVMNVKHAFLRSEGVTEDTVLLPVYVVPDCEAPQLSWAVTGAATLDFRSSTRAPFTFPELLLTREGLEKGYCKDDTIFQVILTTSQGYLQSKTLKVAPLGDHLKLSFEGRIWDLNLALKSVEYQFEIRRDTQIPVMATVEAHVHAKYGLTTAVSSAFLQLKFVGDIRPPEMLVRETLTIPEDTDVLIGEMINFNALVDFADSSTIRITVDNGAVYGASDEVVLEARSEQQVSIRSLRSVMSNLHYIPDLNFNGIDEIHFNVQGQKSTLYVLVQPGNDVPTFEFNSDEMKDWYKYPRMFLPTFQLVDPDKSDMYKVEIRVENGSFIVDQMASSTFDGITMELGSSSSSLRLTSRLNRLNTVFLQRLVEVLPTPCMNDGAMGIYCAAMMELCVDDGAGSICEELHIPEQDLFYRITVPNWANSLSVSASSSINISRAFEVHQRLEVMYELNARIQVSSGRIEVETPSCVDLRDVIDAEAPQIGMTIEIHVPDLACLSIALASIQLQSTHDTNHTIVARLEIFSEEMRLLASDSFNVSIIEEISPLRISAFRPIINETWLTQRGDKLTSLLTVSSAADPIRSRSTAQESVDYAASRQPETTLSPRNTSMTIQVSQDKAHPIGDLLTVHGDLTDSTWFRMEVRVAHGKLSIPINVCCVDIRETKYESELDVVGSALALKRALAAAQFQSTQFFTGTDLLEVNIAHFHSETNRPNVSFSVQIDVNAVYHAPPIQLLQQQISESSHSADHSQNPTENALSVEDQSPVGFGDMDSVEEILAMLDRLEVHEGTEDPAVLETVPFQCSKANKHEDMTTLEVGPPPLDALQESLAPMDQLDEVPVPRVITQSSLYFSTEDAAYHFPDLAIQFDSFGNEILHQESSSVYELDVRASHGTIYLSSKVSTPDGDKLVRSSESSALKLKGTVISLERDLKRLVYFPPQNWNEEQFPGGHIVEWKFVVSYENKSVESFADLVITPRIDDPVITVPKALEDSSHYMSDYLSVLRLECLPLVCDEDTPMTLEGFSVRAADETPSQLLTTDLLEISIFVSHGAITLGDALRANCVSKFTGPQSLKRISFKATADCINRVVKTMAYVGEPNFSGADQLKIRVENTRELDATFDEVLVPIDVVELNDAPYIDVASVFYEAEEDIPLVIEDLQLRDPDSQSVPIRVTMETSYGYLAVMRYNGVKLSTVKEATKLTLEGTLWNVNAAIASVVYTSAKDWNSLQFRPGDVGTTMNGFDTITIHSTDFSLFNGSSVSVLYVYVEPAPDPVAIEIPRNAETSIYADNPPGHLRGDEDTWITVKGLTFSSADDTSRMTLIVSLSVSHGVLTLSNMRGLTFLEGTVQKHSTIKVKGTLVNVNKGAGIRYLPNKDFYGGDTLVVSAEAVDEYTQQHTPSSTIEVPITVDPVNDPPLWSIGSSTAREIQQGHAASTEGISFHDVDVTTLNCAVDSCLIDLIVEASNGFVTMSDKTRPSFSNDMTSKKAAYVAISGTPDELNRMLAEMTFELAGPEYYHADHPGLSDIKLQLTLDDRGTFGQGGPQISTTTVIFNPVTWSRYDISILVPENVITLDEDTVVVFDGDLQLADLDASRSFQSLLKLTITSSHGAFALSSRATGVQVLRNDSDGSTIIQGFFAQLNLALNGSYFIPSTDWYGSEHLSLSVVEFSHLETSREAAVASIFLFVAPVCDEPHWSTQRRTAQQLTMMEDGYLLIDSLSLTNPDLHDGQREIEVAITVNHGGVMLSMTRGLLIQQAEYSASQDRLVAQHVPAGYSYSESRLFFKKLIFRGRVSDINAALEGMIFKPWLDYNSDGWPVDEISFATTSVCSSSTASASTITIQIAVTAVNDPPTLISQNFQPISLAYSTRELSAVALRSSIEAVEDSPQHLEAMELYDPDCELRSGDLRLLVNISCIHCTVTSKRFAQSSEGQASDELVVVEANLRKEDGVQLIVHGSLASLNDALVNQLIFERAHNFNGHAFVLLEISDLGNYGEGGDLHALFVLCVNVKPVSDIPQIHLPQYQSQEPVLQVDENASVLIQGAPALWATSVAAKRDAATWNVMRANLLVNDATTQLQRLHHFSGPEGLAVSFLVAHKGVLLFAGRHVDFGQELWCSDGTAEGTVLLKDIFPGSGDSGPSYLTPFSTDNRVYFAAKGPHLSWLLNDDYRDACQSFRQSSLNSNVYFTVAAHNVWDPKETYDCPVGFRWMSTSEAEEIFVGTIALEGYDEEPFTYFDQCGWRGYEWGGQTRKYFRFSDSMTSGAFKHAGYRDSYRVDTGFQTDLFAGIVCYREPPAHQVTWGTQLWATDGTAMGTERVARISASTEGSSPSHFAELNQRLYFQASSTEFGSELWSTDGTRDGTYLVADIELGSHSSEPRFLTAFDSRVLFSAKTQDHGRELWFSDGNPRFDFSVDQHTTGLLSDICSGPKSSSPQHFTVLTTPGGSALLLFQADDCVHGPELWSTDGTRTGTKLVLDIRQGSAGSLPLYMTSFAGNVYFQADDGIHGAELWTTDGSSSGTAMLVDIAPGVLGSSPAFFTVIDSINDPTGMLVFTAQGQQDRLTEFWRSDGTAAGISKIFPQSREVVNINTDSLDLQLAGHKLVNIPSHPARFFFLGRKIGHGLDFQREASDRPSMMHAEDIAHTRSITLEDIESRQDNRELTVSLNCSKGWLSLGRQCDGVSLTKDGALDKKKPALITLTGSLTALNCAVEKVTYHSKPQENGWDEIHVTLTQTVIAGFSEEGSSYSIDEPERDSSYTVSKRMLVKIRAINDLPTITMASTFYAPMRQWVALKGIEIDDPDADEGILYVSISVRNGVLRAILVPSTTSRGPAVLHATADGDTLQMLEFAATLEQGKAIFESLEYSCDDRYGCSNAQRDYVTVHVDDNGFTGATGPQVATNTTEIIIMQEADG